MSKTYVILFLGLGEIKIERDALKDYLVALGMVNYWEYCFPNSLFIKSASSAHDIAQAIERKYGTNIRLLIAPVGENYWGRLPEGFWEAFH